MSESKPDLRAIGAFLKNAEGIAVALVLGGLIWLISTVNQLQLASAELRGTLSSYLTASEGRITKLERYVERLDDVSRANSARLSTLEVERSRTP